MVRSFHFLALAAALAAVTSVCITHWADAGVPPLVVSQKNRMFNPLSIDLAKGGTVTIVNDDGDLLHHAYIESESFNFDSGDQKPGSRTDIVFPISGDFKVLCGIHPKMKLTVHVH